MILSSLGKKKLTVSLLKNKKIIKSASKLINVIDSEAPFIEQISDLNFEATGFLSGLSLPTPYVKDNYDNNPLVINDIPQSFQLGITKITYIAKDSSGNESEMSFNVNVKDTISPKITKPDDILVEASGVITNVLIPEIIVFDIVDSNPVISNDAPQNGFSLGETIVNINAKDFSGNISSEKFVVNVVDTTPPSISPMENITVESTGEKTNVVIPLPIVFDVVDPSPLVSSNAPIEGYNLGSTEVIYTAKDFSGNISTRSFFVNVLPPIAPFVKIIQPYDGERILKGYQKDFILEFRKNSQIQTGTISINNNIVASFDASSLQNDSLGKYCFIFPIIFDKNIGHYDIKFNIKGIDNSDYSEQISVFAVDYLPSIPINITPSPTTNQRQVNVSFSNSLITHYKISDNSDLSKINWLPYSNPIPFILTHGDGEKNVYAKFLLDSGIETAVSSTSVFLDQTPPERVSGINYFNEYLNKITLTWNKNISDDIFQYEIYYDNGIGNINYLEPLGITKDNVFTTNELIEGIYKFAIRAVDSAGNVSGFSHEVTVKVSENNSNQITKPIENSVYDSDLPIEWQVDRNTDETITKYEIDYIDLYSKSLTIKNFNIKGIPVTFDVSDEEWHKVTKSGYSGNFTGFGTDGKKYENGILIPNKISSWYSDREGSFPTRGIMVYENLLFESYNVPLGISIYAFIDEELKLWKTILPFSYKLKSIKAYCNGIIISEKYAYNSLGKYVLRPVVIDFSKDIIYSYNEYSSFNNDRWYSMSPNPVLDFSNLLKVHAGVVNNDTLFAFDNYIVNLTRPSIKNAEVHSIFTGNDVYFFKNNVLYAVYNYTEDDSLTINSDWQTLPNRAAFSSDKYLGNAIKLFFVQKGKSKFGNFGNRVFIVSEEGITIVDENRNDKENNSYISYGYIQSENTSDFKILASDLLEIEDIYAHDDILYIMFKSGFLKDVKLNKSLNIISLKENRVIDTISGNNLDLFKKDFSNTFSIVENELNFQGINQVIKGNPSNFLTNKMHDTLRKYNVYDYFKEISSDYRYKDVYYWNIKLQLVVVRDILKDIHLFVQNISNFTIAENSLSKIKFNELIQKNILFYDGQNILKSKVFLTIEEEDLVISFIKALIIDNPLIPQLVKNHTETSEEKHFVIHAFNRDYLFLSSSNYAALIKSNDVWNNIVSLDDNITTQNYLGNYIWNISQIIPTSRAKLRLRSFNGTDYSDYIFNNGFFTIDSFLKPIAFAETKEVHLDPYIELKLSNNFNASKVLISEYADFSLSTWQNYEESLTYVVASKEAGDITLYIKLKNDSGLESDIINVKFILKENLPYINHLILSDKNSSDTMNTDELEVSVIIDVPSERPVSEMIINTINNFTNISWLPYKKEFTYSFTGDEGIKEIFIKVRNSNGQESKVYSAKIKYSKDSTNVFTPIEKYFIYSNGMNKKMYVNSTFVSIYNAIKIHSGSLTGEKIVDIYPNINGIINSSVWDKQDEFIYWIVNVDGNYKIQKVKSDGTGNPILIYEGKENEVLNNLQISRDGSKLSFESKSDNTSLKKNIISLTLNSAEALPLCGFYYPEPYKFHSIKDNNVYLSEFPNAFYGEKLYLFGTAAPLINEETGEIISDFVSYKLEYKEFSESEWKLINHSENPVVKGVLGELDIYANNLKHYRNGAYEFKLTVNGSIKSVFQIVHLRFETYRIASYHPYLQNYRSFGYRICNNQVITFYYNYFNLSNTNTFKVNFDAILNDYSYITEDIKTLNLEGIENNSSIFSFTSDVYKEPYESTNEQLYLINQKEISIPFDAEKEGIKFINYKSKFTKTKNHDISEIQGQLSFTYDITPPIISKVEVLEGEKINSSIITLKTEGFDIYEMSIWPINDIPTGWVKYTESKEIRLPDKEGSSIILVWFRDNAGNETKTYIFKIEIDKTPPLKPSIEIIEGGITNIRTVHLKGKAIGGSFIRISENSEMEGLEWQNYNENLTYEYTLSPLFGQKRIYCQFIDLAGNISSKVYSEINFVSEYSAESFSILEGEFTDSCQITLKISSESANQVLIYENNDYNNASLLPFSENITYTLSPFDGSKIIYIKFLDEASNEIGIASQKVELDTISPIIELNFPDENSTLTGKNL